MSKLADMTPPRKARPTVEAMAEIDNTLLDKIAERESAEPIVVAAPASKHSAADSKMRRAKAGMRVATYLPAKLEIQLRVHCAKSRQSLSDAVTEAVVAYLGAR